MNTHTLALKNSIISNTKILSKILKSTVNNPESIKRNMVIIIYIYQTSMITHYSYSLPKVIAKQYSTKASNSNERQNGAGAVRFRSQRYSFFLITTTTNYIQSQNHQSHDNNFKAAKLYTDRRRTRGGLGSDGSSFDGGEIHNGLDPVLGASELRSHGARSRAVEVEVEW